MNTSPDLLSLFIAQFREWRPYIEDFFVGIWNFLVENVGWIELIFILISAVFIFGVIIFAKRAKEEFESYRGLRFKDVLGFGSKDPVEYFEKWKIIERDLNSGREERIKEAVIGARHLFDRLLHESLYKGRTFRERLEDFTNTVDFRKEDELLEAEETAKRLEGGERENIEHEEALRIVKVYEEAIDEVYEVRI